ncbi:hypothetical protein [Thiohalobacter thiocyanaticus]|uniref:Uncharacterized protein n=1 Tax=Thiohalobacter thiocyanaticus TaxID=585455 RepID=A0A426QGI2_9GAMM|nr:hypothetical protein [Thiohalobacter thiocyanaticus]RRQ20858.1 hypothetical protein D6C00_02000 [Thiohalobacter thiocyanaticus]
MTYKHAHYGERIGSYMGEPIFASIDAPEGHFVFDRLARYVDDGYPLDQLGRGEVMSPAGVVYRLAD